MGQVTIYLDSESEARMKAAAKAAGVPMSRWLSELVRERTSTEWPLEVREAAGTWTDFPDTEDLRADQGVDIRRESL
jgi:hypothetical protein